ncbi:MAG TPA: hypothetical protein VHJ20_04065 [Polyangia bacterium]|nr:hypothetical protein [Polyangia bacterium]
MKVAIKGLALGMVLVGACNGGGPIRGGTGGSGGTTSAGGGSGGNGGSGELTGAGGAATPGRSTQDVTATINRDVDVLFMVDNSASMSPLQAKLIASFPTFVDALKSLPLPNVHIGVVSSDMGAGAEPAGNVPGCNPGGDQGKLQSMQRDATACAKGKLDTGANFISNVNGAPNYTGDISDVFACIAALGQTGCGFEHQLGSVLRALGADGNGPAPTENAGFLRPGAYLAVVLITNEDDCSAPRDSTVFSTDSKYISDPLGPEMSYRCNLVGHLCDGMPPPRGAGGPYDHCVSNETGPLLPVADVVAKLESLKTDPNKVIFAALTGPPTPYVVTDDYMATNDDPAKTWPQIRHSCTEADGTYADPSVRISQAIGAFGNNGLFESICNDSFTPALQTVANAIGQRVSPTAALCVTGRPYDTDPVTSGIQPDCTFVDHATTASGDPSSKPIAACARNGNVAPCWQLTADAACPGSLRIGFKRDPAATPPTSTTISCQTCAANDTRAGCQK